MAGLSDISVANFTLLQYTTDSGTTWVPVTNMQSIGEISDEKTVIDVQEYGVNYLRKMVGTSNAGAVECVVNFDPTDATHIYLLASYAAGTAEEFRIVMNNADASAGNYIQFNGFVASKSVGNEFDSARTVTFSIAIDGALGALTANS